MEYLKKFRLPTVQHASSGLPKLSIKSFSFANFKAKLGPTPLGLPFSFFLLYLFSGITSFVLLLLSLLDLGYLSLWLIPPLSFFTLISQVAFALLARATRTEGLPSYFSTVVVYSYILAIAWFVAFIAALVIAAIKDRWKWSIEVVEESGGAAVVGTQVAQIVLSCLEVGLLGTFATKAHRQVISQGEPETWRPAVPEPDKTIIGLSTVKIESGEGNHGETKQVRSSSIT